MLEENNPPKTPSKIKWKIIAGITLIVITAIVLAVDLLVLFNENNETKISSINKSQFQLTLPNSTFEEEQTPDAMLHRIDYLLDQLPGFSDINCSAIFSDDENEIQKAKNWKFPDFSPVWKQIEESDDQCKTLKQSFVFLDHPLSPEEAEYPIAYGALVYKDIEQITYMLSSLYRPNNVFVFMVDVKAYDDFKRRISLFSQCIPNVYVKLTENPVVWAGYEITRAVFESIRILSESKMEWKYYKYLTGFDLPLKTNLEMVRIFKEMNGTPNIEILRFQTSRLSWFNARPLESWITKMFKRIKREAIPEPKTEADSPLPLFKSSLSAVFSRETAEFMVQSTKVQELLKFLEDTECSDESIWGTILGNSDILPIPGGINGKAVLEKVEKDCPRFNPFGDSKQTRPNGDTFVPSQYYISRYQIWNTNESRKYCKGKFVKESCVFGLDDLPILISRPELVVHKLYFNFEPAAYFCLYQNHWKRTLNLESQQKFNAAPYSNLAFVQANRDIPVNNITFYYM